MSRLLTFVASRLVTVDTALGIGTRDALVRLSLLHSDGWGFVRSDGIGGLEMARGLEPFETAGIETLSAAPPSVAGMLCLRFASRGSAVSVENLQPFVRGRTAFAHNGVLSPRDDVLALLTPAERADLRGTTDSEGYFALVRRELDRCPPGDEAAALGRAVARVRAAFPSACLNALVMHEGSTWVIHSPGTVPPPYPAFAARGWRVTDLPPGHGDDYNMLRIRRTAASAIVSTSVVPGTSIPRDTVILLQP